MRKSLFAVAALAALGAIGIAAPASAAPGMVGAVERADSERTFFDATVFGGAEGHVRADRVGALVADLPGLDAAVAAAVTRKLTA